jgi:hypothetical protein
MNTSKFTQSVSESKDIQKHLINYYSTESFVKDATRYVKAIKERRIICNIESVSKSGMSRNIKFLAPEKYDTGYQYLNFFAFMRSLGFSPVNSRSDCFRIGGCGMDMIFHTNYTIIHKLHRLGLLNKKECEKLAQMTPQVI